MGKLLRCGAFRTIGSRILLLVSSYPFREGVAVDAEDHGGLGEVLFVACERLCDVELFKLRERFVEKDVAFEHFVDQVFESDAQLQSSFPVSSR